MSRRGAKVLVALVAAVAMAMPATPAVAEEVGWERIECFSGAIESTSMAEDVLTLHGHLGCASSNAEARLGVAQYFSGFEYGGIYPGTVAAYGPKAPSAFSIGNIVRPGPIHFALCVVTDYEVRVACVLVTRATATASPVVVTPLSTDDPMVRKKKAGIIQPKSGETSPACGHCW
ncbi:hypothetical protein K1W54_18150 [Micromonospora sp. CPCC 205371]|nr:hypothetical protein [Micromonospora sp. CPCC 205371]